MQADPQDGPDPADDSSIEEAGLLTLEELTARVGLSVRTVRFYAARGLVPPPLRRGRRSYYAAVHVARLELVQELQAHGFTLAAIEGYLAGIPDDASAADVALRATMLAPWTADRPTSMSRAELEARADRPLTDDDLAVLAALGVARPSPVSVSPDQPDQPDQLDVAVSQLSAGLGLLDVGFPADAALAAAQVYHRHGVEIAHELYDVFRRLAWPAFREAGVSPADLSGVVERLKPLSIASLVAAYEQGMDETKRRNISQRTGGPTEGR